MKHTFNYLTIGLAILVSSCSGESKDSETSKEKTIEISSDTTITIPENESTHFINPPLDGVNVPFHVESISATEGGELFYESGSIVSFPPNAFVDANGNVIKGKVEVKYREFNDPVEIFLSGIPMTYDSAGVQYDFESAGMTELLAYSEDTPCFVNPESQPEINMVTNDARSKHNLYYLDTVSQQWINQGKDEITDIDQANKALKKEGKSESKSKRKEVEPKAPAKLDPSKQSFFVTLLPGALPELASFDNVTFEIAKNEEDYNPEDTKVMWTNVEVLSNKIEGLYDVTFSNESRSVGYICKPVFQGADYDKAYELFEAKKKKYELAKKERIGNEIALAKINKTKDEEFEKENARIIKLNALIESRNTNILAQNAVIDAQNLETIKENERVEELIRLNEARKAEIEEENKKYQASQASKRIDMELEGNIFRSYMVPNFGVWNCDNPNFTDGITVVTTYSNKSKEYLNLNTVTLIYKDFNGVRKYNTNNFTVIPDSECMVWAIFEQKFAYISYKDFAKYKFSKNKPSMELIMNVMDQEVKSPADIKKYLELN